MPPRRFVPRATLSVIILVGATLISIAPSGRASANPDTRAAYPIAGFASRPAARATRVEASRGVNLIFDLRDRNEEALQRFLSALDDPASPDYHRYLTPSEFNRIYGPSSAEFDAVKRWAASQGLRTSSNAATVSVSGSASSFDQALSTNLETGSGPSGLATSSTPSLPTSLFDDVSVISAGDVAPPAPLGVSGTSIPADSRRSVPPRGDRVPPPVRKSTAAGAALRAHALDPETSTPTACTEASTVAADDGWYTMTQSGTHYGVSSLWSKSDYGAGETIGIYEAATFSLPDIEAYESCMGIDSTISTVQVNVNPCLGCSYQPLYTGGIDSFEAELDIEQVITQAPGANIVVYEGDDTPTDWAAIVDGVTVNGTNITESPDGTEIDTSAGIDTYFPPPNIVTTSWGWYESQGGVESVEADYNPYYEQAEAEGQAIMVASGDSDTTGLVYPADSPYVTGVGGTDIVGSGDQGWFDSTGGISTSDEDAPGFAEPSWQTSAVGTLGARGVPDISADAGSAQILIDTNYSGVSENASQITSGQLNLGDTDATISGCSSVSAPDGDDYFPCSASGPSSGDVVTASYVGSGYGGSTEETEDTAGTSPTSTSFNLVGSTLIADVTELAQTDYADQYGIDDGGTVDISDTRGLITGCTAVPVAENGVAMCTIPSVTTLNASTNDTITATYSGDSVDGPSVATVDLPANDAADQITTVNLLYVGSGYQAYVQGFVGTSSLWGWLGADGTSAAAPMLAGFLADAQDTCSTQIGDLAPSLYGIYAAHSSTIYGSLLKDVTRVDGGTADADGHSAGTGWDEVTGLGTPVVGGFACPTITGLSESEASVGADITVTGTNLTLASFEFGSTPATVVSQGSTSAVVQVPDGAGTVTITPMLLAAGNGATFTYQNAPEITSGSSAAFTVGSSDSFTVTSTGYPTPTLTETGALPNGVTFVDNGNGTATLSGTPAAGTEDTYQLSIDASNGVSPAASQSFTLSIDQAPAITSGSSITFTVGSPGSLTVTSTGYPTPTLSESGALPSGVTFVDHGNGTATLAGTPATGTGGSYPLDIQASNGVSPAASQSFTLSIDQAPAITSGSSITFTVGSPGSLTVTSTGYPTPTLSESGALPSGVTFVDHGNGTATLSGTPVAGAEGSYPLDIGASNGVSSAASQHFTLTVDPAPPVPAVTTTDTTPTTTVTTTTVPTTTSASTSTPVAIATVSVSVASASTSLAVTTLEATSLTDKAGAVVVPLQCAKARCVGSTSITISERVDVKKGKKTVVETKTVTLGSGSYSISKGGTAKVSTKLNAKGVAEFANAKKHPVRVVLTVAERDGKTTTKRVVIS